MENYIQDELDWVLSQKSIFEELIDECVQELKPKIREIIKERWLEGRSVNGGPITNQKTGGGYVNPAYEKIKRVKNPLADGNVDLTLTGALGNHIEIILSIKGHEIISTDEKYNEIGLKYGFDEFGLTPDELEIVINELEDLIIKKLTLKT